MQLRDYQQSSIQWISKSLTKGSRLALVLPTGAGKTFTVAQLVCHLKQKYPGLCDTRVLALVHRRALKQQMSAEFKRAGLKCKVHTAQSIKEYSAYADIQLLILDECHQLGWWDVVDKLLFHLPKVPVIGLTATPDRLSRSEFFLDKFHEVHQPTSFGELIQQGHLSNLRAFNFKSSLHYDLDQQGLILEESLDRQCAQQGYLEAVVRNSILKGIRDRVSVAFNPSVRASKLLCELFAEKGVRFVHVDGGMSEGKQEAILTQLANREMHGVSCADLLIEGVDVPRIDCVIAARAFMSEMQWRQAVGRGSRLHKDKHETLLLDFGDNIIRFLHKGGLRSKFDYKRRENFEEREPAEGTKPCPKCKHLCWGFQMMCPQCGHIFPPKDKPVQNVSDWELGETLTDIADLYYVRTLRKLIRRTYAESKHISKAFLKFCQTKQVDWRTINFSFFNGTVFKSPTIEDYLDYSYRYLREYSQVCGEEQSIITKLFNNEFEATFFASNDYSLFCKITQCKKGEYPTWYKVLGVMELSPMSAIEAKYKQIWESLNTQIATETTAIEGREEGHEVVDSLQVSTPTHKRIAIVQWAYKCALLLHSAKQP